MKVVHIIKATRISGAERHLLMLLTALRQRGVDAHLLVLVEPDTPMDALIAEAEARAIPAQRLTIHHDIDITLVRRIRQKLNGLTPDILHTHLIHADVYGYPAGKQANVPYIITTRHNNDKFRKHPVINLPQRFLWSGYAACIVISDALRQFVVDVEKAPPEKVTVIRYGLEYEPISDEAIQHARHALRAELNLPDEALVLGMACRLVEQKGIPDALKAVAQIAPDYPDAHLVIAGDGDLHQPLVMQAADLNLADRTHFLGWRDDVQQDITAFDVFLMPSLWEGFGLVMIEAMSRRVPTIASAVSALPEIVADGETGLLVPAQDADAIARALRHLLNDRTLRRHMGLLGEARVADHFSAERMADETLALYQRLTKPTTTTPQKRKITIN